VIAQKREGCMRDALSIMDKIVSFTNGELTYPNTLEHLNILDADYYFKLLDCMLQQDLAGAMLLYDDINRKGFEGDIVINGFAEFIRNLLVCKDEKAASLLEVVDSFRERYITTAKQVSGSLLISALNILNETEINYRAARNKRLHVELAIIKLCYLQQALEITAEGSVINKKKVAEGAKSIAFRQIAPLEVKSNSEAKLIISSDRPTPVSNGINRERVAPPIAAKGTKESVYALAEIATEEQPAIRPTTGSKISALDKIRKQYKSNGAATNEQSQPLTEESLQKAWSDYTQKLKEAKSPAAQPFEMAVLRIKDENCFEVITSNNIQQKFIEQDRNKVFAFLQERFQSRQLQFNVIVIDDPQSRPKVEAPLSSRDQLQKMMEQYPLVKELKERLKLDLDY